MSWERDWKEWLKLGFVAVTLAAGIAFSQTDLEYQLPPDEIAELADAPWPPSVRLSPDGGYMAVLTRPGLPGIDVVSQPELKIGGLRINPRTNGPSRGWYYDGLKFKRVSDAVESEVTGLPADPKISYVSWSPDGEWFAFTITTESS